MPADTLEAPSTSAHDVFKSVETFETSAPRPVSPPTITKPTETVTTSSPDKPDTGAGTSTQTLIDKPDAMKPKTALEKIGQVKKPEAEKAPEQKPGAPAVEDKPVDLSSAAKLREAYDKKTADMDALRAELNKVRPDVAKLGELRAELEGSRAELTKLKAMNLSPEERQRFDGLREMHARYEVENSQEYQQKIMAPIHQRIARIEKVAKDAKLDPAATTALKDAMDIQDEIDRNRAIRTILRNVELEPDDFSDYYQSMTGVGKELNETFYPQMEAKLRSAAEIEQAARTKEKQQTEEKTNAEKAEFQKEHAYVSKILSEDALKPLMEDTDLSIDGVTLAQAMQDAAPADNARDRAYQAHAGASLPFVIQWANKVLQENHDLKTANKIRNGSQPTRSDALTKTGTSQPGQMDADSVFKSVKTFGT